MAVILTTSTSCGLQGTPAPSENDGTHLNEASANFNGQLFEDFRGMSFKGKMCLTRKTKEACLFIQW